MDLKGIVVTMNDVLRLVGALLGLFVIGVATQFLLMDLMKIITNYRFRIQLRASLAKRVVTYDDVQHLASRWMQRRAAVHHALRVALSDLLASSADVPAEHLAFVRDLLEKHEAKEPFSELPENISLQLEALEEDQTKAALRTLATSLSVLYEKNSKELGRQKMFGILGFVVGVIGVLVGVYPLFFST